MRTIRRGPGRQGEHPWLRAFRTALAREDLAALTRRGYESVNSGERFPTFSGEKIPRVGFS